MNRPKSEWQKAELAGTYLDGVRGAIPAADLQLSVIAKIVESWRRAPSRVLDLGCGDGTLGRLLMELHPGARAVFVDFSDPMLEAARKRLAGASRARIVKADFGTPRWLDEVAVEGPLDVVVSGFAIHHQPDHRKVKLYAEIHDLLSPGGVFLNLEHVASASPSGTHLFDEFFIDHLHEYHSRSTPDADRETTADTYYRRPDKQENILAPVEEQCEWLRRIGYVDVDCFFKVFELALFGGRRRAD